MANEVKHLGTTDDVTSCDCCGRADLKSTVALEIDGQVVYYGVVCAANALRVSATYIRKAAKMADEAKADAAQAIRDRERAAEFARWSSFCATRGTGRDLLTQIQSLGGYPAAKALYSAEATA